MQHTLSLCHCKLLSRRVCVGRIGVVQTRCTLTSSPDSSVRSNGLQRAPEGTARKNGRGSLKVTQPILNGKPKTLNGAHQNGSNHSMSDDALPLSLYVPFDSLPPDGKFQTEDEETCNPEERNCQTPIYVWEDKCKACSGTGSFRGNGRRSRRGTVSTCLCCQGLGYVRKTSSRIIPDTSSNGNGTVLTLNRDPAASPHTNGKPTAPLNGKQSKPASYWRTRNFRYLKKKLEQQEQHNDDDNTG